MTDMDDKDRSRDRTRRDRSSRFSESSRERDRSLDRGKDRGGMKSSNCRVYVSNIPYEYRWQDLKDLFRSQVGDVAFVELFVDEHDKPRGCGIVEFSDPLSVKKCLDVMHRFELKGRKIVIKEDFGNARDKYGNLIGTGANKRARERDDSRHDRPPRDDRRGIVYDQGPNRSSQDNVDNKWGNTYGLSPQFLESLNITTPLCNRVFVANLDYNVDKKKLKEVFRLAGKVQRVDLSIDKDGRSRGFAIVEYDHPVESVQAISMFHNQQLFDRVMTVRMDRISETLKLPEGLKSIGMGLGMNGEPLRDVARNLPSNTAATANQPAGVAGGAGLLGAVPGPALQMGISNAAAALTGFNNVVGQSALGGLGTTNAMLQAANLAGVGGLSSNLLAGGIGGSDLNLATGLVGNSLVQNPSLAALAANTTNPGGAFGRNDSNSSFGNATLPSQGQNFGGNNPRLYQNNSVDMQKGGGFGYGNSDRDIRAPFGNMNNGNAGVRSVTAVGNMKNANYSDKILISNLPPSASFKMLTEKCNEFGNVQRIEDKGSGTVLVIYGNEWEAERAIKNMDRARIDGRTIDVRFF